MKQTKEWYESIKPQEKIVIVINGGCLTRVYAKNYKTKVELIDIDNLREDEGGDISDKKLEKIIEKATKGLAPIY